MNAEYAPPTSPGYVSELAIRFALLGLREAIDRLLKAADKLEPRYPVFADELRELGHQIAGRTIDYLRGDTVPPPASGQHFMDADGAAARPSLRAHVEVDDRPACA